MIRDPIQRKQKAQENFKFVCGGFGLSIRNPQSEIRNIENFTMAEGPYNPVIMDHLIHPRNIGELEDPDGVAEVKNPACGDTMRLFIKVREERIMDASFLTFGCGPAIAASSITTEMLTGKTIEEALKISNQAVSDALGGLPPTKIHCAHLAEKAIQAVISDYRKRKKKDDSPETEVTEAG